MVRSPRVLRICLLLAAGCSRSTPIDEISLDASGVTISDAAADLSDAWPGWRGPAADGVAPEQGLPTEWDALTNVRWRVEVPGRGHSSPVVVGDRVYLATALEDAQQQLVLAYNRATGEQVWSTTVHDGGFPNPRDIHHKGTNANGTVASDGQRIYIAFLNGGEVVAAALDLAGEIVWQKPVGAFRPKFGYAPSPILYKSLIIVAGDNMGGGFLAALDGASGEIAWRIDRGATSSYSSPTVAQVGGKDQLLISGCDAVASYDPTTGEEFWRTPCIAEATCGTVVTTDERIFASGGYPDRETVCLSASGEKLWSDKTKIYEPSLAVVGEALYGVTDDGIAYCWSLESGDVMWKQRLSGGFSASPLVCGDLLYVPNLEGKTYVFRANPERYEEVAVNQLGDDCYASPAAIDGELYLHIGVGSGANRRQQLVCIDENESKAVETL